MRIKGAIFIVFYSLMTSLCAQMPPKRVRKAKKLISIEKVEGWYEHYFHGQINFSPLGFYQNSKGEKNSQLNYLTVFIEESDLSIADFIKKKNKKRIKFYNKLQVDVEIKQSKNGLCYMESSYMRQKEKSFQWLVYYYKNDGKIFATGYCVEQKYYDKYLKDAMQMMDSFTILNSETSSFKYLNVEKNIVVNKNAFWKKTFYCGENGIIFKRNNEPEFSGSKGLSISFERIKSAKSLFDYIKDKNQKNANIYSDLEVEVTIKNTKYGECYVENKAKAIIAGFKETSLTNYYKINGIIYQFTYIASDKLFDKYLNEAQSMFESVQIIHR